MLKTRFPFFIKQESVLIQKHYQSPRIVILKAACRSFVLLLSTFCGFFPFLPWVLPSPLTTLPIIVSSFSTLHWKVKRVCNGILSREILIIFIDARRSRCPIGLRFLGGQIIIFWRCASCLRNCMTWNLVFDFGGNTTTLGEIIEYINLADFCQISPKHSGNYDKWKCVGKLFVPGFPFTQHA